MGPGASTKQVDTSALEVWKWISGPELLEAVDVDACSLSLRQKMGRGLLLS